MDLEDKLISSGETWMEDENNKAVLTDLDLSSLTRSLKKRYTQIEKLQSLEKEEVNRIKECTQEEIRKIQGSIDFLENMAIQKLKAKNETRFHFPSVGKLSIATKAVSVDDEAYKAMAEEEKALIHKQCPDFFTEKTTISPNKKLIKEFLSAGDWNPSATPYFKLKGGNEILKFKGE